MVFLSCSQNSRRKGIVSNPPFTDCRDIFQDLSFLLRQGQIFWPYNPPPPSTLPILFSQRNGRTWNYANFALVQALHFDVDGMKWGHNLHHTLIVLWRYVIPCTIFFIQPRLFCSSWVRFLSKKRYIKKTFYFWNMLNISMVKLRNPGVHPQLKGFTSL